MRIRKLNKLLQGMTLGLCLFPWAASFAAESKMVWGKVNEYAPILKNFSLTQSSTNTPQGLRLPVNFATTNTQNSLHFLNGFVDNKNISHVLYNQYYLGLPIWDVRLTYHISPQETKVTGWVVNGVEKDIKDMNGKISIEDAKKIAIGKNKVPSKINAEKIIYLNRDTASSKAVLAYHVAYVNTTQKGPSILSFIIDANTGKIIAAWDALPTATDKPVPLGEGPGGTDLGDTIQFKYQFGHSIPNLNSFKNFGVVIAQGNICVLSNDTYRVINLKNVPQSALGFQLPASSQDEINFQLNPFAYYCSAPLYANTNDNGYAPINHGMSPVNDVDYFVRQTINMFVKQYNVTKPIGSKQLPLRVYTHVGQFDNAFACGPHCMQQSGIIGPQQLVFGNGNVQFAPLTAGDIVSHEYGHLVTDNFSNLGMYNQKGAMNEAFSDMTGMALTNYLRTVMHFTWYKEGADFNMGSSVGLNGKPLRYMSNPPLDGRSIDNVASYRTGMDNHLGAGVYNKMFYWLSARESNWNIVKAYEVMLDANMKYWGSITGFQDGACGILSAAEDRGYDTNQLINAFSQVGLICPVADKILKNS